MVLPGKGPSTHLSWEEMGCRDGTPYPERWLDRADTLSREFEILRRVWRKPLAISSAYRTPAYNRAVGGAPRSQHIYGRALDIRPPKGVELREFFKAVEETLIVRGVVKGFGKYIGGWAHIDIRPTEGVVRWIGE